MPRGDCFYITAMSTSKPFDHVLLVTFVLQIVRCFYPKDMTSLRISDVTELCSRPSPLIEPRPPGVTEKAVCDVVLLADHCPTFRRFILPPSSGSSSTRSVHTLMLRNVGKRPSIYADLKGEQKKLLDFILHPQFHCITPVTSS
jgi:hypothetical protein